MKIHTSPDFPAVYEDIATKMGLTSPLEALLCAPDRYEDYRYIYNDFDRIGGPADTPIVIQCQVAQAKEGGPSLRCYGRRGGKAPKSGYLDEKRLLMNEPFEWGAFRLEIDVFDQRGVKAVISVFGGLAPWKNVQAGDNLTIRATPDRSYGRLQFQNPSQIWHGMVGTIAPVYLGAQGKHVTSAEVHALMDWVKEEDDRLLQAYVRACDVIREDCGGMTDADILALCTPEDSVVRPQTLPDLLISLHSPSQGVEEGLAALVIVKKICTLGLQCRAQRQNARPPCPDAYIGKGMSLLENARELVKRVEKAKGFSLTNNQKDVIEGVVTPTSPRF